MAKGGLSRYEREKFARLGGVAQFAAVLDCVHWLPPVDIVSPVVKARVQVAIRARRWDREEKEKEKEGCENHF